MGTVYLAQDRKHGRRVAIKVLPRDLAAAIGPERFRREIAIAARLTHPHIMPLHDSGQVGGIPYYVMPYLEGETLGRRLGRSPPLTIPESVTIAREVADALAYAHGHGIVHRDVKPDNIFLHQGHALLADFGVAKRVGESSVTDSGLAVGTVAYASPEQAAGSREVDPRSDVYSLGCVLYRMLLPMATEEAASSGPLERRFTETPPPIRRVRPEVPAAVDTALARALAPRPVDRFADGAEFARALSSGEATTRMPSRIGRRALLVGLVILALLATAGMLLTRRWSRPTAVPDPKGVVVAGFENRTGDSALAPIGDIATDYIARGLAATGLIHDVFDTRAAALEAGGTPRPGPGPARELARRVGVGTVLWGSYYLERDTLHFESQLVEAATGKLLIPLAPVAGPLGDKTRVIETLRQRVMAGFAVAVNPAFTPWQDQSVPPSYDAYLEMLAADEAGWTFDFSESIRHLQRAVALDSSYLGARAAQAAAFALNGDCTGVDSVIRSFGGSRLSLSKLQQGQLDWAGAKCAHDREQVYRASLAMLAAAPRSLGSAILASIAATESNRPRAALEILRQFEPVSRQLSGRKLDVYLDWVASAYHALGEHRQSLAVARGGLTGVPGYHHLEGDEAFALAALGDTAEAVRLADAWLARPPDEHDINAQKAQCVALELRAHGHAEAGQALMERVEAWYRRHDADESDAEGHIPCLWFHFGPAYYTGRWELAREGYATHLARDTGDFLSHAALGALAARRHDRAEQERMDRWLASRSEAQASYARARIALLAGDTTGAWRLLRKSRDQGLLEPDHLDPDLEPLRADTAYQSMYRPQG